MSIQNNCGPISQGHYSCQLASLKWFLTNLSLPWEVVLPTGTVGAGLCAILQLWDGAKMVGFTEEQLNFLPVYQAIFEHAVLNYFAAASQ